MKHAKQAKFAEWLLIGMGVLAPLSALLLPRAIADSVALSLFVVGSIAVFLHSFAYERKIPSHGWWLLPAALFFFSLNISTIISITPFESVMAIGRSGHLGLVFTASMGIFLFSLSSIPPAVKDKAIIAILKSLQTVLAISFSLQLFGVMTLTATPITLIGLLTILTVYGLSRDIYSACDCGPTWKIIERIISVISTLVLIICLLSIDAQVLWALSGLGVIALTICHRQTLSDLSLTVMASFALISTIFFFVDSPIPSLLPIEISPNANIAMEIATEGLGDTSWIFGAGPGSYGVLYDLHRPVEMNQTPVWDFTFDRLTNHFLTILPQYGILGALLFFVAVVFMLIELWRYHLRSNEYAAPIAATLFFFTLWLYPSNSLTYIAFSFVLLFTFDRALESKPAKGRMLPIAIGAIAAFIAIAQVTAGGAHIIGAYSSAGWLRIVSPYDAARHIAYADALEQRIQTGIVAGEEATIFAPDVERVLLTLNRAVELGPGRAQYEQIANQYERMSSYVEGADEIAASVWEQTVETAPKNPRLWTALADSYGRMTERIDEIDMIEQLQVAEKAALDEAIRLMPEYIPALYRSAVLIAEEGEVDAATEELERLASAYPSIPELQFELGLIYLQEEEYERARDVFIAVIQIGGAGELDSYWYLSAVHELLGNTEAAIEAAEYLAERLPDNPVVLERLRILRSGETIEDPEVAL